MTPALRSSACCAAILVTVLGANSPTPRPATPGLYLQDGPTLLKMSRYAAFEDGLIFSRDCGVEILGTFEATPPPKMLVTRRKAPTIVAYFPRLQPDALKLLRVESDFLVSQFDFAVLL